MLPKNIKAWSIIKELDKLRGIRMTVFSAVKNGYKYTHEVIKETGLNESQVRQALTVLRRMGLIKGDRVPEEVRKASK